VIELYNHVRYTFDLNHIPKEVCVYLIKDRARSLYNISLILFPFSLLSFIISLEPLIISFNESNPSQTHTSHPYTLRPPTVPAKMSSKRGLSMEEKKVRRRSLIPFFGLSKLINSPGTIP
jgi:hypothetical protein